jgi:hypothetical protein
MPPASLTGGRDALALTPVELLDCALVLGKTAVVAEGSGAALTAELGTRFEVEPAELLFVDATLLVAGAADSVGAPLVLGKTLVATIFDVGCALAPEGASAAAAPRLAASRSRSGVHASGDAPIRSQLSFTMRTFKIYASVTVSDPDLAENCQGLWRFAAQHPARKGPKQQP